MRATNIHVKVNTHSAGFYDALETEWRAPAEREHREPRRPLPYVGPRTPAEWDAAFREMAANDETFRDWQGAEQAAERAARRFP